MLAALKKKRRSFTVPVALAIAERVSAGLAYLHEKKIVHGAIHPGEILVSYEGEVRLGDEGIRRLDVHIGNDLADDQGESSIYRAPEVRTRTSGTDATADVYSLALVLLEMLIGDPVWRKPSMTVAASIAALKDFTHIGQAQRDLTQSVAEVLSACTATDPYNRVPSGKELAAGLIRLIDRYSLKTDANAVGAFVRALIPNAPRDDAPTLLLDPTKDDERRRLASELNTRDLDKISLPVDPDLEQKALARSSEPTPAKDLPRAYEHACGTFSRPQPPSPRHVARPTPPPLPTAPKHVATPAPVASSQHLPLDFGESTEAVARAAERASKESAGAQRQWQLYAGVVIIVLIVAMMTVHMATRNARMVRIIATSIPPKAKLYVDGKLTGETPTDSAVALTRSKVRLKFQLSGFETYEVTLETKEDEVRYEAVLHPAGVKAK
jgi:serine/threonine protein kinase